MSKKANVSVCLIVKNEPLLEESLLSIRPYVEEVVIVDTGSTDNTPEIAKKYADIFEVYLDANNPETGLIEDFSKARQKSFDLATKKWVMWMDADDVIEGAENINQIIESYEASKIPLDSVAFLFPYEYSYNEDGKCTCRHFRERLVSNKNYWHFVNPVHEVLIPNENSKVNLVQNETVIFKHKRQYSGKIPENGRNLRILRKYFEKVGESDARQLYYLGLECANSGLIDESIKYLERYIELSGWDDERVMACLKLVEIYQALAKYDNGLKWAFKAIEIREDWSEGYFALAKMFYFKALAGGPNELRNWERCANFAKTGLKLPPTKTLLFINPLERAVEIHQYLNMALNKIGDIQGALDSVNLGLQGNPKDSHLLNNKRFYEEFINKNKIVESINNLKAINMLTETSSQKILDVLNGKDLIESKFDFAKESDWSIPNQCDFTSLPVKINNNQLQSLVTMLWQQYMLYDEISKANSLLENIPETIKDTNVTKKLTLLTNKLKKLPSNESALDIVFYAGDGVEIWNPDSVKRSGIGGSELMLMEQAKRLAKLGHKVRVYNSCGAHGEKNYDGVQYYQTHKYKDLNCDVLIVSRRADALADSYNISSKLKLLWVHDVFALAATNELLLKADKILALSEWHKQTLIKIHNLHSDHIIVTRNGIDLNRFNKKIARNQYKCVNSSSPDRSWPILLEVWPRIKEKVPQAELHLYYGFKNWLHSAQNDQKQLDLIHRIKSRIKDLESLGVVFHDRINQDKLAEEFLSASVWLHPTWFTETSCISAMEMQAAGLRMVTSNIAALSETVGDRGILLNGEWTSQAYQDSFVDYAVAALTYDENENDERAKLQKYAKDNFGLDSLTKDWVKMFYDLIERNKKNPLNPYQPTPDYV